MRTLHSPSGWPDRDYRGPSAVMVLLSTSSSSGVRRTNTLSDQSALITVIYNA